MNTAAGYEIITEDIKCETGDKDMKELTTCPICHEDSAFIETEGGWCVYVQCGHCGTHTAFQSFRTEEEKEKAEEAVIRLWNMGKVIVESRTE